MRAEAALALARLKADPDRLVPALGRSLEDESLAVRRRALDALAELESAASAARPAVLGRLGDAEPQLRAGLAYVWSVHSNPVKV